MTHQIGFSSNITENAAIENGWTGKAVVPNYFGYVLNDLSNNGFI